VVAVTGVIRHLPRDAKAAAILQEYVTRRKVADQNNPLFGDELDFRGADLSGLDLTEASFWGANLQEVPLLEANLFRAVLNGADCRAANFDGSNLVKASFHEVHAVRASFKRVEALRCDFQSAQLNAANFERADLRRASFIRADLRGARLTNVLLESTKFLYARLAESVWEGASGTVPGSDSDVGASTEELVGGADLLRWLMDMGAADVTTLEPRG
jgi:uncharacterized protein YjbI with pentapeptide repeats